MGDIRGRIVSLATTEDARRELALLGVDPVGVEMMIPKCWTRCIKLSALKCHQANILKQEMLSVGGDAAVARGTVACSIPVTDVLLIGTDKQLKRLCKKLMQQPFNLASVASMVTSLLATQQGAPASWSTSRRELALQRPLVMGILNVTPDSFSDGNHYLDPGRAVEHGIRMAAEGADIIDIGGESTRPGSDPISTEEELRRILPVISALSEKVSCPLSVDTWKHEVARQAMAAGAEIINDISGFTFDPRMASVVAETGAAAVLMHTRGTPQTMQHNTGYSDLVGEIIAALHDSVTLAENAGIARSKLAVDPGIGFAKQAAHNLEILNRLNEFACFGLPILIGSSRKSFIGTTLGRTTGERLYGTAATVALAVARGARIVRVHDVREMRDVADMAFAITHPSRLTSE